MSKLLVAPLVQERIEQLRLHLPHALLLYGSSGAGLRTIAIEIAGKDLAGVLEPVDKDDNPDELSGTIKVGAIRNLYTLSRGVETGRRVYIIDNAEQMGTSAQNAFLKLLEEPGKGIHFILTSHTPDTLLPTVRSRLQKLAITALAEDATDGLIRSLFAGEPDSQAKVRYIAAGLPASIYRLASDSATFTARVEIMTDARKLVTESSYDKLLLTTKYAKDRPGALNLIDAAILLVRRAEHNASTIAKLQLLLDIREKLEHNHHVRLQLLRAVI